MNSRREDDSSPKLTAKTTISVQSLSSPSPLTPTNKLPWIGDVILPKDLIFLMLLSFTFGYADSNTFFRFEIFCAMMTGNMIEFFINLSLRNYFKSAFIFSAIFCNLFVGTWLGCALADYFKSRRDPSKTRQKAFSAIIFVTFVACICLDILYYIRDGLGYSLSSNETQFIALILVTAQGAKFSWAAKTGWSTSLMVGPSLYLDHSFILILT